MRSFANGLNARIVEILETSEMAGSWAEASEFLRKKCTPGIRRCRCGSGVRRNKERLRKEGKFWPVASVVPRKFHSWQRLPSMGYPPPPAHWNHGVRRKIPARSLGLKDLQVKSLTINGLTNPFRFRSGFRRRTRPSDYAQGPRPPNAQVSGALHSGFLCGSKSVSGDGTLLALVQSVSIFGQWLVGCL